MNMYWVALDDETYCYGLLLVVSLFILVILLQTLWTGFGPQCPGLAAEAWDFYIVILKIVDKELQSLFFTLYYMQSESRMRTGWLIERSSPDHMAR